MRCRGQRWRFCGLRPEVKPRSRGQPARHHRSRHTGVGRSAESFAPFAEKTRWARLPAPLPLVSHLPRRRRPGSGERVPESPCSPADRCTEHSAPSPPRAPRALRSPIHSARRGTSSRGRDKWPEPDDAIPCRIRRWVVTRPGPCQQSKRRPDLRSVAGLLRRVDPIRATSPT